MLTVDGHCDSIGDHWQGKRSLLGGSHAGHLDLERMIQGGINLQVFAVFNDPKKHPGQILQRTLLMINSLHQAIEASEGRLVLIDGSRRLRQLGEARGAIIGLEGGEALGEELGLLDPFYRLGLRVLGLTWNYRNDLADGCQVQDPGGLTDLGREVVSRAQERGILLDLSHLADPGFWDLLKMATKPVMASHSGCRAITPHLRNLSDDQMRALADAGGVMGIPFVRDFLGGDDLDRLLAHFQHAIDQMGVDGVGVGSDYDGDDHLTRDLVDARNWSRLGQAIEDRWGGAVREKVMGGNFLRVMTEAWGA